MRELRKPLVCCVALFLLCNVIVWGQHGVLLPKAQVQEQHVCDESCSEHDHGTGSWFTSDQVKVTFNPINSIPKITPRRGDVSNQNDPGLSKKADFSDRDTIHGPRDVNVLFGAGESSLISGARVNWPYNGVASEGLLYRETSISGHDLFIGDYYSKNAVVGIYDNDGSAAGALLNVRLYNRGVGASLYNDVNLTAIADDQTKWPTPDQRKSTTVSTGHNDHTNASYNSLTIPALRMYKDVIYYEKSRDAKSLVLLKNGTSTSSQGEPGVGSSSVNPNFVIMDTRGSCGYSSHAAAAGYVGIMMYPYYYEPEDIYKVVIHNHISGWPANENDVLFTFTRTTADSLYTSTRDIKGKKDDGQSLLYRVSGQYKENDAGTVKIADYDTELSKIRYFRPTTILLSESNTLNQIVVKDVQWYAAYLYGTPKDTIIGDPFPAFSIGASTNNGTNACGHYSGWASYDRAIMGFDTIKTVGSDRFVDAAVRLLGEADVCVSGNVSDETSQPFALQTLTNEGTDAYLVLPGLNNASKQRTNFRLKIGGNANMLHTQDSGVYIPTDPLVQNYLYRSDTAAVAAGPGAVFPIAQNPIYMSSALTVKPTNTYTEVAGLKEYNHPRELRTLTNITTPTALNKVPYFATTSSVYGVRGHYNGGIDIHTKDVAGAYTSSIIEIGPNTANQHFFHIYSGGMLKNFRSNCNQVCDSTVIGVGGNAPNFYFTDNNLPLYIINDGNGTGNLCCDVTRPKPGIRFNDEGVKSINTAIANAVGKGDLHIQSTGFVKFYGSDLNFTQFNKGFENEIKILSDTSFIYVEKNLLFDKADEAHLTLWAKGLGTTDRGVANLDCSTGAIKIDGDVTAKYDAAKKGNGLILLRSEYDDVLVGKTFTFNNIAGNTESGELMVQAGQDVRIGGNVTLEQNGQRSMLFEAKKTVAFGGEFNATIGNGMTDGDLTIKAGYPNFLANADITTMNWARPSNCVVGSYNNRTAGQNAATTGGDIWFGGNVDITKTITAGVGKNDTYIRAYNSIHMDADFTHTLTSKKGANNVDTIMEYAETGNVEAMNPGNVLHTISATDSVYFLLQAGNGLGKPCGPTYCATNYDQWHGNILFDKNKTFTMNHYGVGPSLISASRDIENQPGANFVFNYTNPALRDKDSLLITAGRHIETHASYKFNYPAVTDITSSITMQAGHQLADCAYDSCKITEYPSNIAFNRPGYTSTNLKNEFSSGGQGHGSILAFDSIYYDYSGKGTILMTALNGNIETDPYLHGSYDAQDAALVFDHKGQGLTRLEAIDIKLHDRLYYNGTSNDNKNGFVEIAAYDSILTRSLYYKNEKDSGSIAITTDKLKRDPATNVVLNCGDYFSNIGGRGINHGNIVLGYGADCRMGDNKKDTILFDFSTNDNKTGANVIIRAGFDGFTNNPITGIANKTLFADRPKDKGKGYGGNITFDYILANMAEGNHTAGGYMEIRTPNGNIWGKDSLSFNAHHGDLYVDAGLGSLEDTLRQVRWRGFPTTNGNGSEPTLNTNVPLNCDQDSEWRTGNIMMKGANLNFNEKSGNATFRTREGFIDTYDAFNVVGMNGHLLKYAGMDDLGKGRENNWGDISERDFQYTPIKESGSVFFGADDNIMMNYGNSNFIYDRKYGDMLFRTPGAPGRFNVSFVYGNNQNPFYSTPWLSSIGCNAKYDVNEDGYLWYHNRWASNLHRMYRGGNDSGVSGTCETAFNGARDLLFDFDGINSGGVAMVASNYLDMFTKFLYFGGSGTGLASVPGMGSLHGESVQGYGLYMKSQFNGYGDNYPENRRAVCEDCGVPTNFPMGKGLGQDPSLNTPEWTYIGFHDDARILTHNQKSWLEAPVIEFFGHAEMNTETLKGNKTKITLKADSLIFHDSMIMDGGLIELLPFTTDATRRANDMRYGVINDKGVTTANYSFYGPAIGMVDRGMPVLELGYQRCNEPRQSPHLAPNTRSDRKDEPVPTVGGDVIVAFKHGYKLPMFNTVVANHARISFITDSMDHVRGGEYVDAFIRTDLLRIRNKVQFYTDPSNSLTRSGKILLSTLYQMDEEMVDPGMYMRHLHMEPGSELSIPGEDSLIIISGTVVGGFGTIHENVRAKVNGIVAPGFSSLMEGDCQTPYNQGKLTIHNLQMEKDSELRISLSDRNLCYDEDGKPFKCTQADTLRVNDTVFFTDGQVILNVLVETETLDPGCYLFLEYGDTLGPSKEYVRNLILRQNRYGENYFSLYYGEIGKLYLCVSTTAMPQIQRRVTIEELAGVITSPVSGFDHYVLSNQYFRFYVWFNGDPMVVTAKGFYSQQVKELKGTLRGDGSYMYTITNIVEPWDVKIGPGFVANDGISGSKVWAYKNTLYVNTSREDIVSIYNVTGVMHKKLDIPEGYSSTTLKSGAYVVTLKDGTVYKVIIP